MRGEKHDIAKQRLKLVRIDRRLTLFLLFYGCVLLIPIWNLSLIETTEARYGEIAREMLASGNFLEPTFNGIYHFHKPPLPYWCMAAGMAIFGVNDFGVRFFGIVAAVVALFFLYRTSRLFLSDKSHAFAVVLLMASTPLFLAISRAVSTDIYLTCCVTGAQYYLFRQIYGEKSTGNAIGYGLFLGLGFMVKGPVIFLFTLLPQMVSKLVDPRHKKLFTFREIFFGLLCFLVLALPWYVAVISLHPELLTYFTKVQTVDRFASNRFHRNKPFWFFLYLFPVTFLPYSLPLLGGIWRVRQFSPRIRALLLYLFLPLLIFCFSKSKLPPYILPFYGIAALLAVHFYRELQSQWYDQLSHILILILSAGIALSGFIWHPLAQLRWHLACAGFIIGVICFVSRTLLAGDWTLNFAPPLIIGLSVVVFMALPFLQDLMKGYRPMVNKMNGIDPMRQVPTVVYKRFLPSISFYRQELAIMASLGRGRPRETIFELNDRYRQWHVETVPELKEKVSKMPRVFVVTEPQKIEEFSSSMSFICKILLVQEHDTVYDCWQEGAASPQPNF